MKWKLLVLAVGALAVAAFALSARGSSGPVIPRTAGTLEQVYSRLRALGLRVEIEYIDTSSISASTLEAPSVQRTFPAPGTHVPPGSVVTLVGTGGPIGSVVGLAPHRRYRVPNFVGRPAAAAIRWTDQHNLYWAIPHLPYLVVSPARQLYSAYTVTAQSPAPGDVLISGQRGPLPTLVLTVTPRR